MRLAAIHLAALALLLGVTAPAVAAPKDEAATAQHEQAVKMHEEAHDLYTKGEYRLAVNKIEEAIALDPNSAELYYNQGVIYEKLGELENAMRAYSGSLERETDPQMRAKLQGIVERLVGAKAERDAAAWAAETPKAKPVEAPRPPPTERKFTDHRFFGWMVASSGVALAGFATAGILGASAISVSPGDTPTTGAGRTYSDLVVARDRAAERATLADVGLGVGVAALVTTVAFYVLGREPSPPRRAAAPKPAWSVQF